MPLPDQATMPAQHHIGAHQQPHPAKSLRPQPAQQRRQQSPVRRREAHLLPAQLALSTETWWRKTTISVSLSRSPTETRRSTANAFATVK
jgi:hypothetical protein